MSATPPTSSSGSAFGQVDQFDQRDLLTRLKSSYISSSLTILSIIQGVAFAALAATVVGNYPRFTFARWIMALVAFGVLVVVWNQITIDTVTWVQVSDYQGALVPFLVGALEIFLIAAITINIALWLVGALLLVAFSSLGLARSARLARREPENDALLAHVQGMRGSAHAYNTAGIVLFAMLAIGNVAGWYGALDGAFGRAGTATTLAALVPALWLAGWLWRSAWYWRKIVAFARKGN